MPNMKEKQAYWYWMILPSLKSAKYSEKISEIVHSLRSEYMKEWILNEKNLGYHWGHPKFALSFQNHSFTNSLLRDWKFSPFLCKVGVEDMASREKGQCMCIGNFLLIRLNSVNVLWKQLLWKGVIKRHFLKSVMKYFELISFANT